MENAEYRIETTFVPESSATKRAFGVPSELQSCHTAVIDGYVVERHVPPESIVRLLAERPVVTGLAVPGMPGGSPGTESALAQAIDVLASTAGGESYVFARG